MKSWNLISIKRKIRFSVTKKKVIPKHDISLDGQQVEQVFQFDYLGSLITSDFKYNKDTNQRICIAKKALENHRYILTNNKSNMEMKK